MTDSRREFIKKAALLAGTTGLFSVLPDSIQRALAINAEKGSTYLDAEHVVFLMQENRSFDHCYGTLQGVRGFDDPRAMQLPNRNSVFMQTSKAGETFIPFNLDIKNSNATWMQSLPHSWENQVDARNNGKMDGWLESKKSGNPAYAHMPLTMGFYNRRDIPFYYALADAFTVCDQHFCSSLTGTSANRSYFWTGTIREEQNENSSAHVYNDEHVDLNWKTFPERLEKMGISWKMYQNELSVDTGFQGEEDDWLGNFTDNNLEFYKQYNVRMHQRHLDYLAAKAETLSTEIAALKGQSATAEQGSSLKAKSAELEKIRQEQTLFSKESFERLSDFEKALHQKAFVTNRNDPHYRELDTLSYDDNGVKREVKVPKGDVLHQFREDVNNGMLPAVSWLTAPSNFSDHPGSPWYGAWYVSEALDILTKNEEVWKKTIFILTYDENDGYFDHVAPFVPPHTARPETGKCSDGLDTAVEHVTKEQEEKRGFKPSLRRESPIGMGFRVPLVIASPWSRGGWVNSEVFDHTSCLQFLETLLSRKTKKELKEPNISDWRRTVCGDLTSVFRPYNGEKIDYPASLNRDQTIQGIHHAKFKKPPVNFKALQPADIIAVNKNPSSFQGFPRQEKGMRHSCALPYQLEASGRLSPAKDRFSITMNTGKNAGAPFSVNCPVPYSDAQQPAELLRSWAFAVKPDDHVSYEWPLSAFENGKYQLNLTGPNGFLRSFTGSVKDPGFMIGISAQPTGNLEIQLDNTLSDADYELSIIDRSYHQKPQQVLLKKKGKTTQLINLSGSHHWYDLEISVKGHPEFSRRYAGRVETGKPGFTDPLIGA